MDPNPDPGGQKHLDPDPQRWYLVLGTYQQQRVGTGTVLKGFKKEK
jgi:hypothetical protein